MSQPPLTGDSERRVRDAAEQRRAERALRHEASRRVSFDAVLRYVLATGVDAQLLTAAGERRSATIVAVAPSGVIALGAVGPVWLARWWLSAVSLRAELHASDLALDATGPHDISREDLLRQWFHPGDHVVARHGETSTVGTLVNIGSDVVVVQAADRTVNYVSVDSLAELSTASSS